MGMRRVTAVALAFAGAAVLLTAAPAGSSPGRSGGPALRCTLVIKTIHGHPQRHKVCRPGKPSSDLSIELTPSVDHITAGNAIAYRIKVQNQGKYFVPGVVVSIDIPAQGSAFVSEGSGFCPPEPGDGPRTITCRLGTLPPPETADWPPPTVIIARGWADRAGSFAVKARVQSASARDPRPANNRARLRRPSAQDRHRRISASPSTPTRIPHRSPTTSRTRSRSRTRGRARSPLRTSLCCFRRGRSSLAWPDYRRTTRRPVSRSPAALPER